MYLNELENTFVDQTARSTQLNGLTERVNILVLNLFIDKGSE